MMDPNLVMLLAAQGLRFWADFQERGARGELTEADVDAAAAKLDTSIAGLRADIAAKRAATAAPTP